VGVGEKKKLAACRVGSQMTKREKAIRVPMRKLNLEAETILLGAQAATCE
jgi:hypothetical protein